MLEIVDVTDWEPVQHESRGKRRKVWLRDQDEHLWLRKSPRDSRPFEPAMEVFSLRLAGEVGLNACHSRPARWFEDGDEKRGIVLEYFLSGSEELWEGHELLGGVIEDYDHETGLLHTLENVWEALEVAPSGDKDLTSPMFDMLLFDAWIGNGDRHQGNWGVVVEKIEIPDVGMFRALCSLAPIYDPASCLGVELQDGHPLLDERARTEERLSRYVERCPSGFGDGVQRRTIPMREVVRELQGYGWTDRAPALLRRFRAALDEFVVPFLQEIPEDWLPEPRKTLARLLLERRLQWLEEQK